MCKFEKFVLRVIFVLIALGLQDSDEYVDDNVFWQSYESRPCASKRRRLLVVC